MDVDDLRSRAENVLSSSAGAPSINTRAAARVLHGIIRVVAMRTSVDQMQRTCAALVRHELAWTTRLSDLPHEHGAVSDATQLIAAVAAALIPLAGVQGVRDALSFWATEDDPSVWAAVASGASS